MKILTSQRIEVHHFVPNSTTLQASLLRLLLIVSLWQGPTVWGHDHSQCCEHLFQHLQQFHLNDAAGDNQAWHWHVSIPEPAERNSPVAMSHACSAIPGELSQHCASLWSIWLDPTSACLEMFFPPMNQQVQLVVTETDSLDARTLQNSLLSITRINC